MNPKRKTQPTKTLNPLHFEDLEPHRFEDLIRQLIYEFRDWQSIEATGRSGSDEGLDIRAWEKVQEVTNQEEGDEENVGRHLMDGNLWVVQCKREKAIGPTRVSKILDELDGKKPPYGYILAAPVNFSKKSYDIYRDTLRGKGVSEFYLWGRPELEDMLVLPKYDRVLFTFFGISLAVKRRSRTGDVKFVINNKNKLLRILSEGRQSQDLYKSVLVRDIKDEKYPRKEEYSDFDQNPRWREQICFGYHPRGLLFHVRKYYAFKDEKKKVFDYTEAVDLVNRQTDRENRDESILKMRQRVSDYWKHLPRKNQSEVLIDRLIPYSEILAIDEKGDILHEFPHLYVDFHPQDGPFTGLWQRIGREGQHSFLQDEGFKRASVFPKDFPEIKKGEIYKEDPIRFEKETFRQLEINLVKNIFDVDGKYSFLNARDVIQVSGEEQGKENVYIEITHKYSTTVREFLIENTDQRRELIEVQTGRKVENKDKLDVFEFERTYEWALK